MCTWSASTIYTLTLYLPELVSVRHGHPQPPEGPWPRRGAAASQIRPQTEHRDAVGRSEAQLGVCIAYPGLSPGPINRRLRRRGHEVLFTPGQAFMQHAPVFTPLKRPFKRTLSPRAAGCLLVALGPLGRARRMSKKDEDGDEHEHAKVGLRVRVEGQSWSTWSAVISLTSRAGELRSAPSGPDDRDRVAGKRALAPGVRVRRERAIK